MRPPRVKRRFFSNTTFEGRWIPRGSERFGRFLAWFQDRCRRLSCTKHLSRVTIRVIGPTKLLAPSSRNASVPSYRPTQKVGLNAEALSSYLRARVRGRTARSSSITSRSMEKGRPSNQAVGLPGFRPSTSNVVGATRVLGVPGTTRAHSVTAPVRRYGWAAPLDYAARNFFMSKAFSFWSM